MKTQCSLLNVFTVQRPSLPGRAVGATGRLPGSNLRRATTGIVRAGRIGLGLLGVLLCSAAQADIAFQDGSLVMAKSTGSVTVSQTITVTPGASVLVVSLLDRNGNSGHASPASLTWSAPGYSDQTITRIVSVNNAASTYADSDIFYLYNPNPGTATITATDTSGGTPSAMVMQAYTLSGVNTSVAPQAFTTNSSGATLLTLPVTGSPMVNNWAVVNCSYGTGGLLLSIAANSGAVSFARTNVSISEAMGYVANLGPIGCTVTADSASTSQKMALGVVIFAPIYSGPAAPTGLTATPGDSQVSLSWADGSGGAANSYIIWRALGTNGFNAIGTNNGNAATTYLDTRVIPNTLYSYSITAVGIGGIGMESAVASATPTGTPPTPPTNLAATGMVNQVSLSWADSSGGKATSYLLLRSITSGSGFLPLASLAGNTSTNFIDRTVYDGTTYYYVVEAVSAGGTSAPPAQVSATPYFALPPGQSGSISLLDGGINAITTVLNGAGADISSSFTVSQGASVMVVELWDRNQQANNSSPAYLMWETPTSTQMVIRAVSQVSGASTYSDCNLYYLWNPAPGAGTISGTDTNGPTLVQGMTMMPFTLRGVDTTVAPVTYSTTKASATTLSITTSTNTPATAWAAVLAYDGNTGQNIAITSSSGTVTSSNIANNQQQALGYIGNLGAGSGTITMTDAGAAAKCTLAVAVFMPAIGKPIAVHDGSIYSTNAAGAGVATISMPFAVSQGASALAAALYENNNNTGFTLDLVWTNTTLGISQPLTKCVAANPGGYTWTWAVLYYLMDPLPGTGFITGTDTATSSGNLKYMFLQAYTLDGVDTTSAPQGFGAGNPGANVLTVDTPAGTVAGSWAPAMSVQYNGGGGNNVTITSSSGGVVANNFRPGGLQCTMGYVTNLAAGVSTITSTATGAASLMDLALEVFSPLVVLSAPTGLIATGQTDQIQLSWTDSTSGQATGYIVLRSLTSGQGYTAIATNTGNTSTTYIDKSVVDLTTYYYVVQAVGPGGVSVYSAEVSAYALGLPPAVAGLAAEGGINSVDVTWSGQIGVTSYNILRSTTSGSGFSQIATSAVNSFTDTGVTPATRYYYKVSGVNGSGTGPGSAEVSAIPVVAFFTNWFGLFNGDAEVSAWSILNAGTAGSGVVSLYYYLDPPPSGPSTGCLIMDAFFGIYTTNDLYGIARSFGPALNLSTYKSVQLDIKNQAGWDQYNRVQAVQLNLQVPFAGSPTYMRGSWPDIVLNNGSGGTGGSWTHYTAPLTNWAAFDLTRVSAFGINVFDFNYTSSTEVFPSFANIAFCGAPAWTPTFTVASRMAAGGSTSVTLVGTVSAIVGGAPVYLWTGTPISVTVNGVTQTTSVNDATGNFSIDFNTTGLANGVYPVTYSAPADMVSLVGVTNSSTTLTLTTLPPLTPPTILPPAVDVTGANLKVPVATQLGYNYYLLSATNLTPPVAWITNSVTPGTGGTITNMVTIDKAQPGLFLKCLVN